MTGPCPSSNALTVVPSTAMVVSKGRRSRGDSAPRWRSLFSTMGTSGRAGLTRPSVIAAALKMLDEVGLDAFSVRRLAVELGVRSPALYWHFRNKQDLLDGMADAIVVAAGMGPPRDGESWSEWLTRRARAYRKSVLAHPDGARIVASARGLSPATIRRFDEELTAMVQRGFTAISPQRRNTRGTVLCGIGWHWPGQGPRREFPPPPEAQIVGQVVARIRRR